MDTFAAINVDSNVSVGEMLQSVCAAQAAHADASSCSQRLQRRMPLELRSLYARLHSCTDVGERAELKRMAWQRRKMWMHDLRLAGRLRAISQGKVIEKSKKLFKIESMKIAGQKSLDCDAWSAEIKKFYEEKWACGALQNRVNILDYVRQCGDTRAPCWPLARHSLQALSNV